VCNISKLAKYFLFAHYEHLFADIKRLCDTMYGAVDKMSTWFAINNCLLRRITVIHLRNIKIMLLITLLVHNIVYIVLFGTVE